MWCYLLLLHCCSAPSTCYSVQFGIILCFSKVSCFMLILMNIKNKLKCENNYLIRDQNNFSFIAEIAGLYVLKPGDKRAPNAAQSPLRLRYTQLLSLILAAEISLKYFTLFSFFSQCLISLEWKTTLPLPVGSCFFLGRASSREFRLRLVFIFVHLESQSWSNRQPTLGN